MPRVKCGTTSRARHKKVLARTRGHRGQRHSIYRRAHESMLHALDYAYVHRRQRKGDMRRLWIARINAAARGEGVTYGQLMDNMKKSSIDINRKLLADMAVTDPASFKELVKSCSAA